MASSHEGAPIQCGWVLVAALKQLDRWQSHAIDHEIDLECDRCSSYERRSGGGGGGERTKSKIARTTVAPVAPTENRENHSSTEKSPSQRASNAARHLTRLASNNHTQHSHAPSPPCRDSE